MLGSYFFFWFIIHYPPPRPILKKMYRQLAAGVLTANLPIDIVVVASYSSSYSSCLTHQHTRHTLATGVLTAILLIDIMVVASYS